jgi:hypothetical protein
VYKASKQMFDYAAQALDKCGTNASCYIGVLDEPIPSSPTTANWRAIKSSWMAVVYGESQADKTRAELLKRVDKVKDASARLALVEAIDELTPKRDGRRPRQDRQGRRAERRQERVDGRRLGRQDRPAPPGARRALANRGPDSLASLGLGAPAVYDP